jgi:hypothetical protein
MDKEKQLAILKDARKHSTNPSMQKDLDRKIAALEADKTINK